MTSFNKAFEYSDFFSGYVTMKKPNDPVSIYEGKLMLEKNGVVLTAIGQLIFIWFPNMGPYFKGEVCRTRESEIAIFTRSESVLKINDFEVGRISKLKFSLPLQRTTIDVSGYLEASALIGDHMHNVSSVKFSLLNFREIRGNIHIGVKRRSDEFFFQRLTLEDEDYLVTIDPFVDITDDTNDFAGYKKRENILLSRGGYLIQYTGELFKKEGTVKYKESLELLHSLGCFLTFANGRRTSPLFLRGVQSNQTLWEDYTNYKVDSFKEVRSWLPEEPGYCVSDLWKAFRQLWSDSNDQDFLMSVIHWYVEANGKSGKLEGAIIMAQAALELIYNWWIVEKKRMIVEDGSSKVTGANKIRLIISQLPGISLKIPESYENLQNFKKINGHHFDACDAIVTLRNALVHSNSKKRKLINPLPAHTLYEALQLSLFFIEMSILRILGYSGMISNRTKAVIDQPHHELVPWTKSEV